MTDMEQNFYIKVSQKCGYARVEAYFTYDYANRKQKYKVQGFYGFNLFAVKRSCRKAVAGVLDILEAPKNIRV